MNKKIISLIGLLVVVGLGVWVFGPGPEALPSSPKGALTGPDIPYDYLNVGGVRHVFMSTTLALATTTPCAIQAPAATSTLLWTSLKIETSSSTATVWSASKDTTAFATTTSLLELSLGSGAKGTMFLPATSTAIDSKYVFGPNEWVVWGLEGIAVLDLTSDKLLGACSAEFLVN